MAKKLYYNSPKLTISELEPEEEDIVTASEDSEYDDDIYEDDNFEW